MATFKVMGRVDPLLQIQLTRGENILAESGAMVCMDATLELSGQTTGGMMQSLQRKVLQGESFFLQNIAAVGGDGEVVLAPGISGDIRLLEVGDRQYYLYDGAFLVRTSEVTLESNKTQGAGKGFLGGMGGMGIVKTGGSGTVAVAGRGAIYAMEPQPGKELIVDNGHVVAWDSTLEYEVTMATEEPSSVVKKIFNSQSSGEGFVLRFKGTGKILVCSRNRSGKG